MNITQSLLCSALMTFSLVPAGQAKDDVRQPTPSNVGTTHGDTPSLKPLYCLPRVAAPTLAFKNPPVPPKSKSTDSGIETDQFLELMVWGEPVKVRSGFDVFDGLLQPGISFDMQVAHDCGADFVFVRVSGQRAVFTPKAKQLWAEAKQAGIEVYPYHYLGVEKDIRDSSEFIPGKHFPYSDEDLALVDKKLMDDAARQARNFLAGYADTKPDLQGSSQLGFPGYIAIDIEERLSDQAGAGDPVAKKQYGLEVYKMACVWIKTIKDKYPNATTLLYTSPSINNEYSLLDVGFRGGNCLHNVPIWVAVSTAHGGHPADDIESKNTLRMTRDLCFAESSPVDRCLFHQYSSRGTVGIVDTRKTKKPPAELDLDRYNMSEIEWR